MPVRDVTLKIDQGASFDAGPFCWIGGYQGVNPVGTTASAIFRQTPEDAPLLELTTTATSLGQIVYGTPIYNQPFWSSDLQATVLVNLYPVTVSITAAGVALLIYPFMLWKLTLNWTTGKSVVFVGGEVEVSSI